MTAVDQKNKTCTCKVSTGIHEESLADGTPERPYGLTFGFGELDDYGYWERGCFECARRREVEDSVPLNSYWPFESGPDDSAS